MRLFKLNIDWRIGIIGSFYLIFGGCLLIFPFGEYPLAGDEWIYLKAVEYFHQTGKVWPRLFDITVAIFLFQMYIGVFFSKLFGYSILLLRLLGLGFGFLAALSMYFLTRELEFSPNTSFLSSLLLLTNPLFFFQSFFFLTDVPYIAIFLLASLFLLRGIKQGKVFYFMLGNIFSILSFFIRQTACIVPVSIFSYFLFTKKKSSFLFKSSLIAIFSHFFIYGIYYLWMKGVSPSAPSISSLDIKFLFNPQELLKTGSFKIIRFFQYLGLFLLPLGIGFILQKRKELFRSKNRNFIIFLFILTSLLIFSDYKIRNKGALVPALNCQLTQLGLGPAEELILRGKREVLLRDSFWIGLTILATFGGGVLAFLVWENILSIREASLWFYFFLFYFAGILLFAFFPTIMPRYLLPLYPFACFLVFKYWEPKGIVFKVISGMLMGISLFLLLGLHEYCSWNEVREKVAQKLLEKDIPIDEIDGGREWGVWQKLKQNPELSFQEIASSIASKDKKRKYVVSFSPLPDYLVREKFPYYSVLRRKVMYLYLLERESKE
jgi:4-amino-4-deoxy-L-arabinose transferase-like glycosyltransferase